MSHACRRALALVVFALVAAPVAAAAKRPMEVADLLKKLGRPDRFDLPHDGSRGPKGTTVLAWEEATEVEASFKDGRTVRLVGRFSPVPPGAAWRRSHAGESEVGCLPGGPDDRSTSTLV